MNPSCYLVSSIVACTAPKRKHHGRETHHRIVFKKGRWQRDVFSRMVQKTVSALWALEAHDFCGRSSFHAVCGSRSCQEGPHWSRSRSAPNCGSPSLSNFCFYFFCLVSESLHVESWLLCRATVSGTMAVAVAPQVSVFTKAASSLLFASAGHPSFGSSLENWGSHTARLGNL